MKLGIIGATGWLGAALGTRLLQAGWPPGDLLLLNRQAPRSAYDPWPGVRWMADAAALCAGAEAVVLSVRPEDFPMPGYGPGARLVVSFMTAWSLDRLAALHPGAAVVRAMPNSGAPLGQSFTPWVAGPGLPDGDRALVRRLLAAMGDAAEVEAEAQLDYLSALSGSGAAYPALMAQAMLDHAAGQGLPPDVAGGRWLRSFRRAGRWRRMWPGWGRCCRPITAIAASPRRACARPRPRGCPARWPPR